MKSSRSMTPPPPMECSLEGCGYVTPGAIPSYELVIKTLEVHTNAVHKVHTNVTPKIMTEKPKRPTISVNMTESDWVFHEHKWQRYKRQSGIAGQQVLDELWASLDAEMERLAFQDGIEDKDPDTLLSRFKRLAVTTVHPSLHVVTLHNLKQNSDENVKAFAARVRGIAKNCELKKTCSKTGCNEAVSFLEETCYHVVMTGLISEELQGKVLTQAMIGTVKDLPTLVEYVTAEESSKMKSPTRVAAVNQNNTRPRKCSGCGLADHGDYNTRKNECKAYGKKCNKCSKLHHFTNLCRSVKNAAVNIPIDRVETEIDSEVSGFVSTILPQMQITSPQTASTAIQAMRSSQESNVNVLPVPHYVYSKQLKQWRQQAPKPSPTVEVSIALDRWAYKELKLQPPDLVKKQGAGFSRARQATLDSGAQLTIANEQELSVLGIKKSSIFPLALTVNTVTHASIDLVGGVFLKFSTYHPPTGTTRVSRQLCYISKTVKGIYLSEEACMDFGYIPDTFPEVAAMSQQQNKSKCENTGVGQDATAVCSCPRRTLPPSDPPKLPCDPTVENLNVMKDYILQRYAASAFNCCEKQQLPLMTSAPPLRLFVDNQASPVAALTPSTVPLHWEKDVKAGLDRDVRLGVIEPVPVNNPVKWCSRMVVTPKADGTPRRVIDFTPINKHAPRQLHHTRSPYAIATAVPPNKVKTVLDNWHGYHSVPIHPDDKDLTTFITPYGRYRYKTAPQGFISAGDGYTQRMDLIVQGTQDYDHCVDDSILWDDTIESSFYRVCSFLEKCANAGCIFNPKKFQFASAEVEFLGFKITMNGLGPTDAFLETIRSFPTPKSLTDVRSWFGTINQISYTFAVTEQMKPFRSLLSSKLPFIWSQELEEAFILSKEEIIKQCSLGVRKFELNRPTALATDWSRASVGCWLTQKFCSCMGNIPGCCKTGWQTVHVASRFNSPAVSRYHPVEGEAFAATWALEKCKLFVLGNPQLTLAVDHKPLIAILGQKNELADILNPRLMNFKLKSMAYSFTPVHIAGKKHVVPDTLSRRSDSPALSAEKPPSKPPQCVNVLPEYEETFGPPQWVSTPFVTAVNGQDSYSELEDEIESLYTGYAVSVVASIASSAPDGGHSVITWEQLQTACNDCPVYTKLRSAVLSGNLPTEDGDLSCYAKIFPELTVLNGVVMLQQRLVIPRTLRENVLLFLHSAHAGTAAMISRAQCSVYWPEINKDIANVRQSCSSCHEFAPSNPRTDLIQEPDLPSFPFQVICSDFFEWGGKTYLIIVDKYSNWLSILKLPKDDSKHLMEALRIYFSTFGVAEIICTDGASVYTSSEMSGFFRKWGVKQRISTAYNPQANKRAEVGVKAAKRIIRENVGHLGTLNTNKFHQALLAHRNAPDPTTKVSPAQIVFGHDVKDIIPRWSYTPQAHWSELASKREDSFLKRHYLRSEAPSQPKRLLKPLQTGDQVYIQDQTGPNPNKWSKSGTIIECLPYDGFLVKIDGSNRLTKRNRKYLRKFTPFPPVQVAKQSAMSVPGINDQQSKVPAVGSGNPTEVAHSEPKVCNGIPQIAATFSISMYDYPLTLTMAALLLTPSPPFNLQPQFTTSPKGASRNYGPNASTQPQEDNPPNISPMGFSMWQDRA